MRAKQLLTFLFLLATVQVYAQTNDPRVGQQYYIGAHNIDQSFAGCDEYPRTNNCSALFIKNTV